MTARPLTSRIGDRTNVSPANNASWLLAVGILAVAIPASDKIAKNEVFFAAHGVSPVAWVILLVAGLVIGWALLFGLLALVRRLLAPRGYDIVASLLMLAVTWFFVGNALSITIFSGVPLLGALVGLAVAVGITLVARRLAMGSVLVVCAGVAAAIPLVGTLLGGGAPTTASSITFAEDASRPNVLWVVSDELSYPAAFDQAGNVRPGLPNLASLASGATTYSKAYSAANYTDYAVPSMLSGISDVAAQGTDRMQKVRAGIGIIPGMASAYSVVMKSPIYSFDCDSADCAAVGSDQENVFQRYWGFAKDTAAIAGKTALAAPFSNLFPSLDGKWRDFWSGGDEFGSNVEGDTNAAIIDGIQQVTESNPDRPFFAFWHTIRTHAPWVVDAEGKQIYPFRVPVTDGAHMIGAEADQSYSTEDLKYLERRLWALSVKDFDRQLGLILDDLKATGRYDDTMIIVTADHGATMTEGSDRRVGDTLVQRWSEVAHVPLVIKMPGQTTPSINSEVRSTGQIAATVLATTGGTPDASLVVSPSLDSALPDGPVFTTVAGGVMTPWAYPNLTEVDPWRPEDLTPPDPAHPFAVGIDPALIGQPVPSGWSQVTDARVQVLPGDSDQQVVIVERSPGQCPAEETTGLVVADGVVTGSVLWEDAASLHNGQVRGWAIVPKVDPIGYSFWCPSAS